EGYQHAWAALDGLEERINAERWRPQPPPAVGGALGNSLPLPAALGQALTPEQLDHLTRDFNAFWRDEPAPPERVKALARDGDGGVAAVKRVLVTQLLLKEARASEKALDRACKALAVLPEESRRPLPAEANLALQLNRVAERPLNFVLVKQALDVAALA